MSDDPHTPKTVDELGDDHPEWSGPGKRYDWQIPGAIILITVLLIGLAIAHALHGHHMI
jgi:hypothetical protein